MLEAPLFLATAEGGLFDINATLPLMALQFLLLAVVLNFLFYKPLGQAIDERTDYVRTNQLAAQKSAQQADVVAVQLAEELGSARRDSQKAIAATQAEAQKQVAQQVTAAQRDIQQQREHAQQQFQQEKQAAFQALEQEVDVLSREIFEKLVGSPSR